MDTFSIVVPVYNSEKYLPNCINSLVNQTIDKDRLEVILVDDGSTDGSADLCRRYSAQYPFIEYVEQANSGASHARNVGIQIAKGDIIGFVDSDDWISQNLVEKVAAFFENCSKKVQVAVCPVYNMRGKIKKPHYANGKFSKGTRVLSLNRPEWNSVVSRIAPAFFRAAVAKRIRLDEEVVYYEDTKYCSEALMESMLLGVVAGCSYYYRRSTGEDCDSFASITSKATGDPSFYIDSPRKVSLDVLNKANNRFGEVPLYFQFVALGEMKWRVFYNENYPEDILSEDELREYAEINSEILGNVDDDAIVRCGLYSEWQKVYLLSLKHNTNILQEAKYEETGALVWRNRVLYYAPGKTRMLLTSLSVDAGTLIIRGFFSELLDDSVELYSLVNGVKQQFDIEGKGPSVTKYNVEKSEYVPSRRSFELRVAPDKEKVEIRFYIKICGRAYPVKDIGISSVVDIASLRPVERVLGNYIVKRNKDNIYVCRRSANNLIKMYGAKVRRALRRMANSQRRRRK